MSQENVEVVRRGLDAFNRRDRTAWLAVCDPEVEDVPPREWPESDTTRGSEAVWDLYVENTAGWREGDAFENVEMIDAGDKVVAHVRGEMRGKASGASVTWSYWQAVTFRNGKVLRLEWFADRNEALEAVGLRE